MYFKILIHAAEPVSAFTGHRLSVFSAFQEISKADLPKIEISEEAIEVDAETLEAALERSRNSSTESKFLPNLTLEQLKSVDNKMLLDYALKPQVYMSIPQTKLDVFKALISRLPTKLVRTALYVVQFRLVLHRNW